MTDRRRLTFDRAVQEELKRRKAGVDDGAQRVRDSMNVMRTQARKVLAGAPSDFDSAFLPKLLAEIDNAVKRGQAVVEDAAFGVWADAAKRGAALVDGPLAAVGFQMGGPLITRRLVDTLENYAADKLGVTLDQGRAAIEAHVRLGVLGGQSPHEVMRGIDAALENDPVKPVSHRAEIIMRTETGKIHSVTTQARMEDAVELVSDLGKKWVWSGKSRMAHSAVNGQRRPVDQPFDVGGEKMMHPRDPNGSAANVIACGCESVPYLARFDP